MIQSLIFAAAIAATHPLDIKGAKIGQSEAELKAIFPSLKCPKPSDNPKHCNDFNISYAGTPAGLMTVILDDRVCSLVVLLEKANYHKVKQTLISKFQPPDANLGAMGRDELLWENEKESFYLKQSVPNLLDKSAIQLTGKLCLSKYEEIEIEKRKVEIERRKEDI